MSAVSDRRGQARLGRGDEPLGGDADALDGLLHAVVFDDHAQDVQGVELGLAALEREASCLLQDALRAGGQEPAEVDRPSLTRLLTREIPGQELVERARAGFGVEVFGHQSSWELELGTLKFNAEGARVFPSCSKWCDALLRSPRAYAKLVERCGTAYTCPSISPPFRSRGCRPHLLELLREDLRFDDDGGAIVSNSRYPDVADGIEETISSVRSFLRGHSRICANRQRH